MGVSRTKRRLLLIAVVVLVGVVVSVRALDGTVPIAYYRAIDRQTLAIETITGPGAWTRVTGVTETPTTVTITVGSIRVPLLPGTDVGQWLELTVHLGSPIGDRMVVDGSSGEHIRPAPSPWPPDLGNP